MAKITKRSILGNIKGKIGGVSIYNLKNVGMVIRNTGGPSKEQMESNPNMEVTRKNQNEFGGCATASAALRKGLVAVKAFQNGDYSGMLVGKLRRVAQHGQGELGSRDIDLRNAPHHLLDVEIRKDNLFSKTYQAPLIINLNPERTAIDIQILRTGEDHHVKLPKYMTHFQLTVGTSLLSKYTFNQETSNYQPTNPHQNAIGTHAQYVPLEVKAEHTDILLSISIPHDMPLAPDVSISVWMGITYGLEERGRYEAMAMKKCMKCVAIF